MLAECIDLTRWTLDLLHHLSRRRAVRRSYRRSRKPLLTGGSTLSESGRTDESSKWAEPLQEKYATRNPVSRLLIGRFLRRLDAQLIQSDGKLLDVGTGEGDAYHITSHSTTTPSTRCCARRCWNTWRILRRDCASCCAWPASG